MLVPFNKLTWTLSAAIAVAIVGYCGWVYTVIDEQGESGMVVLSFSDNPVIRFLAERKLRRQVLSGDASGPDALSATLMLAVSDDFDREEVFAKADELLGYGIDIDAKTSSGNAPLIQAVLMNSPEAVVFLLQRCADPGATWSYGPDPDDRKDAIELAHFGKLKQPQRDISGVIEALERRNLLEQCDGAR